MFAGSHLGQGIYGQRFLELGQRTMCVSFLKWWDQRPGRGTQLFLLQLDFQFPRHFAIFTYNKNVNFQLLAN